MSLMLEEIRQQPEALRRTIDAEAGKVTKLGAFLKARDVRLIVLVARGSSDNAALYGRYLFETATGIPVSLAAPSVFTMYGGLLKSDNVIYIGVSQSGEGEDINFVLKRAKSAGAFTLGITNEAGSTMAGLVDEVLVTQGGRERSVAATKTFTGQMMMFAMLAEALREGGPEIDFRKTPDDVAAALASDDAIRGMVERYVFMDQCVVVGRGLVYACAYEMALKLMETCYVVAERFSTADFFHGPLAIIERHFPTFVFAPAGKTVDGTRQLLERLRDLHADTVVFTGDESLTGFSPRTVRLPSTIDERLAAIPYIVPGQLFAAHLAAAKGLDPDAPRSLTKVTRTL